MSPLRRLRMCALVWLCTGAHSGCDGFGRPVVGEYGEEEKRERECETFALPACAEALAVPKPIPTPPLEGDWPTSCTDGSLTPEELAPEQLGARYVCRSLAIALSDASAKGIATTLIETSRVRFTAPEPHAVQLLDTRLTNVDVAIEGPVALEIVGRSFLSNVRVELAHPAASLVLRDGSATKLVVHGPESKVDVARTPLTMSTIVAADVVLDTTTVKSLEVSAEGFFAAQVFADGLRLQVARGQIAGGSFTGLRLERCESLLFSGTKIVGSSLRGCGLEKLRFVESTILSSQVSGRVDSVASLWTGNAIGGGEPSRFEALSGATFGTNLLCGGLERIALVGVESVTCNVCPALAAAPTNPLCGLPSSVDPQAPPKIAEPGFNPLCPQIDQPVLCDPPPFDPTRP